MVSISHPTLITENISFCISVKIYKIYNIIFESKFLHSFLLKKKDDVDIFIGDGDIGFLKICQPDFL